MFKVQRSPDFSRKPLKKDTWDEEELQPKMRRTLWRAAAMVLPAAGFSLVSTMLLVHGQKLAALAPRFARR